MIIDYFGKDVYNKKILQVLMLIYCEIFQFKTFYGFFFGDSFEFQKNLTAFNKKIKKV